MTYCAHQLLTKKAHIERYKDNPFIKIRPLKHAIFFCQILCFNPGNNDLLCSGRNKIHQFVAHQGEEGADHEADYYIAGIMHSEIDARV